MTNAKPYKRRIADKLLLRKLKGKGAVLIEGAKWCGKTTTAEQICRSVLYMSKRGMVKNLCLGINVAEAEDEEFGVVDAVEFGPERLDF